MTLASAHDIISINMANLWSNLNRKLGLDLGTGQIRIWVEGEGLLIDEPNLAAVKLEQNEILAVGQQAAQMEDRVGEGVEVKQVLESGQLRDDELLEGVLKIYLQKIAQKVSFLSPSFMVSLPTKTTPAKKQAAVQALYQLGSREVYTVSQPLAAAIGAGVPIADASGCFLLQLGAGVAEAAVISLGRVVASLASDQAGTYLSRELVYWLKKNQQLAVSNQTGQQIMHQIANLSGKNKTMTVSGVSLGQRSPQEIELSSDQIREVVVEQALDWAQLVKQLLARVPPALTADVLDKGLLLSGGVAQLEGIAGFLTTQLEMPVSLVEKPEQGVADGIATILNHLDQFKQSLAYQV